MRYRTRNVVREGKWTILKSVMQTFEANQPRNINPETIPEDVLLVEHSIFCGKDIGITIHINPEQKYLIE